MRFQPFITRIQPSIKARWSKHLGKLVYNCSKIFLPEDHPYRRDASAFNGKPKRTERPATMTPVYWIREFAIKKEKEFLELLDSNGEPLFNDLEFFEPHVEKMSIEMKRKSIFYELPYWEHLKIIHLLDPMHILKNVSSSLWSHILSKK